MVPKFKLGREGASGRKREKEKKEKSLLPSPPGSVSGGRWGLRTGPEGPVTTYEGKIGPAVIVECMWASNSGPLGEGFLSSGRPLGLLGRSGDLCY